MDAHAINAPPGLIHMGDVGQIAFFGYARSLLCSEPGANGVGECEITSDKPIKVVTASETYWLKPSVDLLPSRLWYGPDGLRCEALVSDSS